MDGDMKALVAVAICVVVLLLGGCWITNHYALESAKAGLRNEGAAANPKYVPVSVPEKEF